MADATDRSLLPALRERDRAAWAQMYDLYAQDVFTFLAHLLHGNQVVAEELHQEIWLAALAGIERFDNTR